MKKYIKKLQTLSSGYAIYLDKEILKHLNIDGKNDKIVISLKNNKAVIEKYTEIDKDKINKIIEELNLH